MRTVADPELLGAEDEELLAFARGERRVIMTQDEDFLQIASQETDLPGMMYAPQRRSIGEVVRMLDFLVQVSDAEEMEGRVEYI